METTKNFKQILLRIRPYLLALMLLLGVLTLVLASPHVASAQGGPELSLTKTAFKSEVESGEPFEYVFNYRCASISDDCEGAVITDHLPPEVEFVPDSLTSTPHIASYGYDSATHTITWVFKDPLPAGSTGILKFQVRFPSGTLPGTTTSNTATFSATNAVSVTTLPVNTTVTGVFEMYAEKSGGPAVIGFPATFDLKVCSPDSLGGVRFTKPTLIDYLPDSAIFSDAQGNQCSNNQPPGAGDPECWVYDDTASPRTVTWYNLPTIEVGGCFTRQIALQYNADPGATQVNNMDVIGTPEGCEDPANLPAYCNGQTERTISDDQPFSVIPPYPEGVSGKISDSASSFEGTESLPGESTTYVVSVENTGYEDLINVVVTDTIPAQLILQSFTIGPASAPGDAVNGFYQVDGSSWFPLPGNSYTTTTTIDATALDLHGGNKITELKWELGTVAIGEDWASTVIGEVDPAITPTYPPESFQNCTGFNSDNGVTSSACSAVSVIDERAIPRPAKSSNGKSVFPEEYVDFTVGLRNDEVAQLPFDNPMLVDLLPEAFDYITGTATILSKPAGAPDPNFEVIPNYNSTGRTLLRWTWQDLTAGGCDPASIEGTCGVDASYSFQPGENVEIGFTVQVKKGTPPGLVENVATIVDWTGPTDPDDPPNSDPRKILLCDPPNQYVDTNDLDGDGITTEVSCIAAESTEVGVFLAMDSEKWVRGQLDCATYNDPNACDDPDLATNDLGDFNKLGLTMPGERVDYLLHTINDSNVPVTDISFIDITPYIGDTGVIDLSPRLSQWRPNLQAEVVNLDSTVVTYTVFYSAASNPCRPDFVSSLAAPPDCQEPYWSTTLPSDPTRVQSIKVDFCTYNPDGSIKDCLILNPNETLSFGWHMVAPNSAPGDASCLSPADDSFDPTAHPDCQIAWNSFGFKAVEFRDNDGDGVNDSDHLELLPSEPKKVGIRVAPQRPNSVGDYVWLDVAGLQNDGIQQSVEQQAPWGVNGVRVELWDADTDAFIDYRITGDDHFGNPGYYLFSDLPDGNYYLRFFPPAGYTPSPANQGTDDALDSDGEIAGTDPTYGDYLQTTDIALAGGIDDMRWDFGLYWPTDYGDAPFDNTTDFYPTNAQDLANAGLDSADAARHVMWNDLRMGATVDDELDGFPSLDAWGDDLDGTPDDEDGVTFDRYLGTPEQPSAIMVIDDTSTWQISLNVPDSNRLGDAYLNAWLDFNGDGDWNDVGEQIAMDTVATQGMTGTMPLNIPVPAGATPGTTHARFRLSYTQGLGPTGAVNYGEVEDYQVQLISKPVKSIVATSEAHTTDPALTIGEIVRYQLLVSVPEGVMSNFVITDHLHAGLVYLDDGTASHSFTSDNGMTSTEFTVSGGPFADGVDPVFTLGTVTNPDVDDNEEFVTIEFNALVLNNAGNTAGDTLNNDFNVTYDTFDYTSEPVSIDLVEPSVSIVKTVTTAPPIDAGDQVTYQLQLTNAGTASTAFDLSVDDLLDANLDLADANDVSITAPAYATVTNNSDATADEVHVLIDQLEPGDQATILVTVTVRTTVSAGEIIPNVANLAYTSLPGPNGTSPNATGSTTPGASGDVNGERTYGPSDSKDITIDTPQVDKLDPTPTDYTIGEDVTYDIKVTLPEGTTQNLQVIDDLPPGLEYQSYQIITTAAASNGHLGADFNGTLPAPTVTAPGGSGGDVTFDFGDTVTTADNNAGTNSFLIEIVARVLNTAENNNGDNKVNTAILHYTNPNTGGTETLQDSVTTDIIEPFLTINKEVIAQPTPVGPGGQITYRVTIQHAADSAMTAYDVVMTDTLPASLTNVQVTSTTPAGLTWSYDPATGLLQVPSTGAFDIALGDTVVIEYTADVTNAADPGGSIDNTANTHWSTMSGDFSGREREYDANDPASVHVDGEFGDLPDGPYPTTYANNGARHLVPSGANSNYLGAAVDAESDGQPNASATGDDANPPSGPDDEDGVQFLTPITPGQPATIQITANADGYLHGWIDFDADGTLDDITLTKVDGTTLGSPTVMRDYPVAAGVHTYTFDVPATATALDAIYSRFRFTSYDTTTDPPNDPAGQLGPDDKALDGEVEDYVLMSLGNYVWFDSNGNGVQDAGEPPIADVLVNLLDASGNPVTDADGNPIVTTTDANGWYNFGGLPAGDYIVEVAASNWDAGNVFGAGGLYPDAYGSLGQGGDDHDNTDDNGNNDGAAAIGVGVRSVPINLAPGQEPTNEDPQETTANTNSDLTIDFGFTLPVSVGSLVWRDINANGIQDVGEPTIEGATVTLLDSAGNPVTTDLNGNTINPVATAADGIYHFTDLPQGDYIIQVQPPAGMKPTPPQVTDPNTDNNTDSNIASEPSSGVYRSGVVSLSIGGEPTGEVFADGTTPDQDGDRDDSGNMTVDFGFVVPVSLGSFVWMDVDRNGVQDVGEPGIAGATVTLLDSAGNLVTTDLDGNAINPVTTGADGVYNFSNLPPGDYMVDVQPPAGYRASPVQNPNPNDDNNADSNIASDLGGGVWRSGVISLLGGTEPTGEAFADGSADQDTNPDADGNMTLDFGFFKPVSLGSLVWLDLNANGMQDVGEPGIANATVTLLDGTGNPVTQDVDGNAINPVTTGTDGIYHFTNLPPGDYMVEVQPPAGHLPTPPQVADPNTDDNTDSNIASEPSAGVYRSGVVTLTPNSEPTGETFANGSADQDGDPDEDGNMTVDFGFIRPVSVGSLVWHDIDGNGVQDAGEPLIAGATVHLVDTAGNPVNDVDGNPVADVTTGASGIYHFENLIPGDYKVQVTPPAGFFPSPVQQPDPNTDDNADSNIATEPSTGVFESGIVTLAPGLEPTGELFADASADQDGNPDADGNMTVDFGFVQPVSLGSLVWKDLNADGLQGVGEPGVANATVTLLDGSGNPVNDIDGNPVADVTTGADGIYHFANLYPGSYIVQVTPPAGMTPTANQVVDPNTDDNADSNIASEPSAGVFQSGVVTLSNGQEPTGETFADGSADQDGNPDADGNMTVDFGFVEPVSLGSLVWHDLNGNGIQDNGEPPIEGATVHLVDAAGNSVNDMDGNPVADITTGSDGVYHFENLVPGDYKVQVTPPAGYTPAPSQVADPNNDDNTDSNIASEPSSGVFESGVVTLSPGLEPTDERFADGSLDQDANTDANGNMTVDFGFIRPVSVGSLVWLDVNANGSQDVGEPAIENATVSLVDAAGNPVTDIDGAAVGPVITGSNGVYVFDNLIPGDYRVRVQPPAGYAPTLIQVSDPNTDDNTDSNIASEPSSGVFESGVVTLTNDQEPTGETFADGSPDQDGNPDADGNMTVDFGFIRPVSLGSLVWLDQDGNGVQDSGEPPIAGAVVSLVDGFGLSVKDMDGNTVSSITTDATGQYHFTNLKPGAYRVRVQPPAGYWPTFNQVSDPNTDDNADSNIASEPSSGVYQSGLIILAPGREPQGELFADGSPDQDGNPDADGNMTVDFGFMQPVSLGSLVWYDANVNGVQDIGEAVIMSATVSLVDVSGNPVNDIDGNPVAAVTTGADGVYHFSHLAPGDYRVRVQPPSGMKPTPVQQPSPNTDDNTDSNIESEVSAGLYQSGVVTLAVGQEPTGELFANGDPDQDGNPDANGNMTVDFGFVQPVSVGSLVWLDQDADGVQDAGEPGVANATVSLLDSAGNPVTDLDGNAVADVLTGADGVYHFSNLAPGDYMVQVQPPAGYLPTPTQQADPNTDDNTDSNIASEPSSGVYRSGLVTLSAGAEPQGEVFANGDPDQDGNPDADGNMTVDFGFVRTVSVGSFVWIDSNGNGVQDTGEPGIANATVSLLDAAGQPALDIDGNPVPSVTTAANGVYTFTHLLPGDYIVEVTPPVEYMPAPGQVADPNTDDNTDSNIASEPSSGVYRSGVVNLQPQQEPTNEVFADGSPDQDGNPDADGNMTVDFGFMRPVSVGSLVWFDQNANGVQDAGEPGIENAQVSLLDATGAPALDIDGNPVASVTTGATGVYFFANLAPGDYLVEVTPPASFTPTAPQIADPNNGDNTDSNIATEPSAGVYRSGAIQLRIGAAPVNEVFADGNLDQDGNPDVDGDMTLDFGFVEAVSLGSLVWQDSNGNGVQETGEPPIQGAVVTLLDSSGNPVTQDINGNPITPVTTGLDGLYHFGNLPPGDYMVSVQPPTGYTASPTQNPDPSDDNNADSNIASEPSAGVYRSGIITLTPDQEPTGELFADGSPDQDGAYDASGNMTIDFGFTPIATLGSLGDFVWWDIDQDGLQDAGEPGIEGVTLTLSDGYTRTTTTDANGHYTFANLVSDRYTITVDASNFQPGGPLENWTPSPAKVGQDDAIDSDGNETSHAYAVSLGVGEDNPNVDFGFFILSSYTMTKQLNTIGEIRIGDPMSFTVSITNTGDSWLAVVPLTDLYDTTYLSYGYNGQYASPASDDNVDDGHLNWADITTVVGDIAPGASAQVTLWFTAVDDTSGEPNGATVNTVIAQGVMADPDGPNGPLGPTESLDDIQGATSDDAPAVILRPTGLFITDFTATTAANEVSLQWTTASETNIAGFRVRRQHGAEQVFLPDEPVSAQYAGMDRGAIYTLQDDDLSPGLYLYTLQAILLDGRIESFGVIRALVRSTEEPIAR